MDKFKIIIFLLGILPLINCQKMKNEKPMLSYNVQISHPGNNYLITPVEDNIITLEEHLLIYLMAVLQEAGEFRKRIY